MRDLTALHRINEGDNLVMKATASRFVSNLTTFAEANPEMAQAHQDAMFSEVAQSYGYGEYSREPTKPFIYNDGVAIIPVRGVLLNRYSWASSYATGYNFLRAQLNAVLGDLYENGGDVKLLAWDVDCPGGEAVGCFELCKEIYEARALVQQIAVIDALAASGGYAIASAPQRMVCTPSGSVGSIGVYRLHVDLSKALEMAGVKYTFFQAGEHKTDGNPFEAPSSDAAKEMQRSVDKRWEEFIAVVAEQRDMDPERVRDTQAQIYRADEALDLGLIDEVKTPSEAVSDFLAELASDDPSCNGDDEMALPKNEAEMAALIAAAEDRGKTSVQVPNVEQAASAAVAADRTRRQQIMALPEAEKRQKLATTMADGDYTVEQAKSLLAVAAEEGAVVVAPAGGDAVSDHKDAKPGETVSEFTKRMNGDKGPNIAANDLTGGNGGGGEGKELTDEEKTAMILGDQAKLTGAKHRSFGQKSA